MITVDFALLELMPDSIVVERQTGYTEFGQRAFDVPFTLEPCRIEGRVRRVTAVDGSEKVSSVQIYLSQTPGLSPTDRVTLPSPWTPTQPEIIAISRESDNHGGYYEAIYCA
jgi:hypothetical protein